MLQPATSAGGELYLSVEVNGSAMPGLAVFGQRGGQLQVDVATWRGLGLRADGIFVAGQPLPLADIPGVRATYRPELQQLSIDVPLRLLDRPATTAMAGQETVALVDPDSLAPGLVFNYDLFARREAGVLALGAFTEQRLFGLGSRGDVLGNTLVSRAESRGDGAALHRNVRLDTYWRREFADEAVAVTVGDFTSGAVPWSRSARLGGLRIARDFGLQPYRTTAPLAALEGAALLPSTVELFVNGIRQSGQAVPAGEFVLAGVPMVNGAGQARMVVTDFTGQSRVVEFDLYGSPQLLAEGLTDWSLDAGWVRRYYGLRSFAYRGLMASASLRHGWRSDLTVEAHAEAGAQVVQVGGGAVGLLPAQAGVVSGSLALSRQADVPASVPTRGRQHTLGYQWSASPFSLSASRLRRDAGFRDAVADAPAGPELQGALRGSDSVYVGFGGGLVGQIGLSLVRQLRAGQPTARFMAVSWSRSLGQGALVSLNLARSLQDGARPGEGGATSAALSVFMPLEKSIAASATVRRAGGRTDLLADASRGANLAEGGWGWRVQAGAAHGGDTPAQAEAQFQLDRITDGGQWSLGMRHGGGAGPAAYGSASGGLVALGGQVGVSRRVDDAFTLVSTAGVPGVTVRHENRVVGRTDANGMLFVTQLSARQNNQLSIEALDLPPDVRVEQTARQVVPPGRSGVLTPFALRRVRAVQFSVRDAAGQWLAPGQPVVLEGAAGEVPVAERVVAVVGYEGLVYWEDPPEGARLRAGACRWVLAPMPQAGPAGTADLGEQACR